MKTQKRDIPAKSGSGGGKFLKLDIGQSINGVFKGEPRFFWQKWPKGKNKEVSDEPKPGFEERCKIDFVIHEDGEFKVKIFDCTLVVYNQIHEINEAMDIESIKCKITRQSNGKSGSNYFVLPLLNEKIDPRALAKINEVYAAENAPPQSPTGTDGVPF